MEQWQIICFRYFFAGKYVDQKEVLEVGCGPGLGLHYMAGKAKRVVGVDCVKESIACAQRGCSRSENIKLFLADAHALPVEDSSFDVAMAMATIIYLDLDRFLQECSRVLRKKGCFVFCTPNRDRPCFRPSALSRRYYSVPELFDLFGRHGFNLELFGAFPISKTRQQARTLIRANVARIFRLLKIVPKIEVFKGFARKAVGYQTLILPAWITDEDMKAVCSIQTVPVYDGAADCMHQVLYGVAKRDD
jgi:SAM-dependent methyltransferase